jgi:Glycosyltransferase family 28 C-terminal domain
MALEVCDNPQPMTRIALVYFDAGGGHRNAAAALQEMIQQQQLPWQVELVNLQEILDPIDCVRRMTGLRVEDVYNRMLRHGWTLGSRHLLHLLQGTIRAVHKPTVRLLENSWRAIQPEVIVSVVPHFNRALCESFSNIFPKRPFVTLLTDLADYPPHFWIERQDQFLICGSQRAVEQARQMGHPDNHVFRTSGMILHPRFYQYVPVDRAMERGKRGLDPQRVTGLVLFGGQGARRKMVRIDRRLGRSRLPVQLIFICGRNEELVQELRSQKTAMPRLIEGFTTDVPYYMHLSDFLIGKPGPGSLAEALFMGLPVIVERNAWTLPQERYNTDWVRESQVGLVLHSFGEIDQAVAALLDPTRFSLFQRNAKGMKNRALFEILDILQTIVRSGNDADAAADRTRRRETA